MGSPDSDDAIREFVLELLGTGAMLCGLVDDLVDALPPDEYPGEDPGHVVVEMIWGTIATTLVSADPADLRHASHLIRQSRFRTLEHLQLAQALSSRMHDDGAGAGRSYG